MSGRSGRGNQNFNSLPHTEVDTGTYFTKIIPKTFQLTTSHRGRRGATHKRTVFSYFNSLPHTEVDQYLSGIRLILYISTHYLTQRQTLTLAHRSCGLHFNSLPHTEVDEVILVERQIMQYFNSLPHTEVDASIYFTLVTRSISTHYLTQRQTILSRDMS